MAIEIVDFPTNSMVIFHSYVNVYQRVTSEITTFPFWSNAPGLSHQPTEADQRRVARWLDDPPVGTIAVAGREPEFDGEINVFFWNEDEDRKMSMGWGCPRIAENVGPQKSYCYSSSLRIKIAIKWGLPHFGRTHFLDDMVFGADQISHTLGRCHGPSATVPSASQTPKKQTDLRHPRNIAKPSQAPFTLLILSEINGFVEGNNCRHIVLVK